MVIKLGLQGTFSFAVITRFMILDVMLSVLRNLCNLFSVVPELL